MAITLDGTTGITTPGLTNTGAEAVTGNLTVNGNTTLGDASTDTILMTGAPSIGGAGYGMGMGFRNRIINGAMVIDQRYGGTATANTINGYNIDRFQIVQTVTGKLIAQQNAGSVTPPAGFVKYQGITSQSAYSVLAGDYYLIQQAIEGLNVTDLAWGTASAATVTLSFWVRSSLTGTFGGSLRNSAGSRSYPFSYTISSANTWEQKSITIAGDTTGTWLTDTGTGIWLAIGLGVGTTYGSGTAGAWVGSQVFSITGATSVVGTNGATFYITGVQLEKGSTATTFDYRPYGTELALCYRYYQLIGDGTLIASGYLTNTLYLDAMVRFPVVMRASPTVTKNGTWNVSGGNGQPTISLSGASGCSLRVTATATGQVYATVSGGSGTPTLSADAEL